MPARKSIEKYPQEFQRLTHTALSLVEMDLMGEKDALLRIPCQNEGQASNVMLQIRQYWKELDRSLKAGILPEFDPRAKLAERVNDLACRAMPGNKATIEVLHRSQLVGAKAIAGVLPEIEAAVARANARLGGGKAPVAVQIPQEKPQGRQEQVLQELYGVGGKEEKK